MALQSELPEIINGFKVLKDLGTKLHSGKPRRFAIFECKVCHVHFEGQVCSIKRLDRISCSRDCSNKFWLNNLEYYCGFKIIKTLGLHRTKRYVIAECPFCTKHFQVYLQALKRNKSCGCLDWIPKDVPLRLIRIRNNMIQRCHNPKSTNYCRYGQRGISVCDEWRKPTRVFFDWALANGYHPSLSIDRINNNGIYEPSNCRWATRIEQMANTRRNKPSI